MVWSVLSSPKFFPSLLIALDLCAACRWAFEPGEWRRCVYWAAAAILTASVTW
jgi:hypothetical protein